MVATLGELAKLIGAGLRGSKQTRIQGLGTLRGAKEDQISFFANSRYRAELRKTKAAAVILHERDLQDCPVAALICENPYLGYAQVAQVFTATNVDSGQGRHESAVIARCAVIHENSYIGPHCTVGRGVCIAEGVHLGPGCVVADRVSIGADSRLVANVTICANVIIGERFLAHPGVVIGSDGFGLANDHGRWVKIPQLGGVRIGDDVEIGANTTVDRGALEDTVIMDGAKLDNQIQVGHNVHIGVGTAIAGCVGISGSARIGNHCMIGGGAGIGGHIDLADGVHVAGMSAVAKSLRDPGMYASVVLIEPIEKWRRNSARLRHLDELAKRVASLEKHLRRIEEDE